MQLGALLARTLGLSEMGRWMFIAALTACRPAQDATTPAARRAQPPATSSEAAPPRILPGETAQRLVVTTHSSPPPGIDVPNPRSTDTLIVSRDTAFLRGISSDFCRRSRVETEDPTVVVLEFRDPHRRPIDAHVFLRTECHGICVGPSSADTWGEIRRRHE